MDSRFTPFILIRTSRRYLRRLHVILGNLFVVCAVLVALGVASAAADMPSTPQPSPQATLQGKAAQTDLVRGMLALRTGHVQMAYTILEPIAASGSPHAQYAVGLILAKRGAELSTDMFDTDTIRALDTAAARDARRKAIREAQSHDMFGAAARQGHIGATFELGFQYERGIGTKVDIDKALSMYRIAGVKNHLNAQYNLAVLLSAENGAKPNLGEAYMWAVTAHHNAIKKGHKLLTPGLTDSLANKIRTRIRHGDAVRAHRIAAKLTGLAG